MNVDTNQIFEQLERIALNNANLKVLVIPYPKAQISYNIGIPHMAVIHKDDQIQLGFYLDYEDPITDLRLKLKQILKFTLHRILKNRDSYKPEIFNQSLDALISLIMYYDKKFRTKTLEKLLPEFELIEHPIRQTLEY